MDKITKIVESVTRKSVVSLRTEGVPGFAKRSARFLYYRKFPEKKQKNYRDILFINGCTLPHPTRYRVDHQIEQLLASGLTADSIFYEQLDLDMLKYYRGFVFFRCPITEVIREFIKTAKLHNKRCFFDIDDLVIDQKYTDKIDYVNDMTVVEKNLYNDGVNRMRETLQLCDYAITTTKRLQSELTNYIPEVYINRNVASDEMVARSQKALQQSSKDDEKIIIGYFSGSITHNENFEIVLPSLISLLNKYPNLYLKIVGILDLPKELELYTDRIITIDFMDWRSMSYEIATCDINIAPLKNTIFNEAKSENKWTEAALVKVVTLASNIGAFREVIKDGISGILVNDNEWYEALDETIANKARREIIAKHAYDEVLEKHTTIITSNKLAEFLRSKLVRNIAFVLPSTDISGGVNVVLKHAEFLQQNGWDVNLIDSNDKITFKKSQKKYDYRVKIPGFNVIVKHKTKVEAYFDTMVATLWATVSTIKHYPNVTNRLYFVQNLETDFYVWGAGKHRLLANSTYSGPTNLKYITMSLWCQKWLKERFNKESKYASNGLDLSFYTPQPRNFDKSKTRILIEGDSSSEYKNTDEAFRIVQKLDPALYEISYLSYRKEPKNWYKVDHFYNRISPEKVGEVYAQCDILVKTSLLESFSYPPLEMMATGGLTVVLPNDGNVEYLKDGENCLFYKHGDIDEGVYKIELLVNNKDLRERLIKNGLQTAKNYEWEKMKKNILVLYE